MFSLEQKFYEWLTKRNRTNANTHADRTKKNNTERDEFVIIKKKKRKLQLTKNGFFGFVGYLFLGLALFLLIFYLPIGYGNIKRFASDIICVNYAIGFRFKFSVHFTELVQFRGLWIINEWTQHKWENSVYRVSLQIIRLFAKIVSCRWC